MWWQILERSCFDMVDIPHARREFIASCIKNNTTRVAITRCPEFDAGLRNVKQKCKYEMYNLTNSNPHNSYMFCDSNTVQFYAFYRDPKPYDRLFVLWTFGIIIEITVCNGILKYFTWVQSPLQMAVAKQIYISVDYLSHIMLTQIFLQKCKVLFRWKPKREKILVQ